MRALKPIRSTSSGTGNCFEALLAQFSAAMLELNPVIGARQISQRLTERVREMFEARTAVLALAGADEWEIAAVSGNGFPVDKALRTYLAGKLSELANISGFPSVSVVSTRVLGRELAAALGWHEIMLARMSQQDGKALGMMCVANLMHPLSAVETGLLEALASHVAIALENVRIIGRIEQSRKQWVEDVDAISDFIVVHDAAGKVVRLNRALADMLEVRPIEAIGWDVSSLGFLAAKSLGRCPFCQNLSISKEEVAYQVENRTYVISTSRIASEEGGVRTIHVLKDITERREAERRYRRERDFNNNILNNTQSMILVLDTAGLISYANRRCGDTGYRDEELIGRPLAECVAPARRATFLEALARTLEGEPAELEVPFVRPTSVSRQLAVSLSAMRDERGEINSVVVVMSDITDSLDLQAKLMHTEKMAALGQLVSGVAHEVNNPLAAIIGFTDLLLENPKVPEQAKVDLELILREAQRTRVIVQNLLSFARQMPARHEPVQLNSILRQTIRLRSYDFSKKGAEVVELLDEGLPLLVADPHQLQQVFLNILNNAYDAIQETQDQGKIEIRTSCREGEIEISFRDNGPGISHPDRIFDPFFTTKEVGKGTGLGLSICYGIVREHHGEIRAWNNSDGSGCTFAVRLPAVRTSKTVLMAEAAR